MHVSDVDKVFSVLAGDANGALPFVYQRENLGHRRGLERRGAFREASNELIEELFGRDLEVEGKAAVLDEDVEQKEGEHGDVLVSRIDQSDCRYSSLPGP